MIENKLSSKIYHNKREMADVISLLSCFSSSEDIIYGKNKFIILWKDDSDLDFCIDKENCNINNLWTVWNFIIKLEWLAKQLFKKDELTIQLPMMYEWKDITPLFIDCYRQLVKSQYINDICYQWYSIIIWACTIMHDWKKIWFRFKWYEDLNVQLMKNNWAKRINFWRTLVNIKKLELEDVLSSEIEQWYINRDERVWDKNWGYGYTHLLRQHAKFRLTTWFRKVLVNWKQINIVYASRGNGKTYDAAYIAARALLDPRPWFAGRPYREIKYFVDNKENIWSWFFRYVKSLLWDLWDKKKWLFKINESDYSIECLLTWNRLEVITLHKLSQKQSSWLWTSAWEWLACDDCIVDEAARIPNSFWRSFSERWLFETENIFIISTANEETPPDHWTYQLLLDWELWDKNVASYRVTIDDNEVIWFWHTEEKRLELIDWIKKKTLADQECTDEYYFARLYCIIFDKKKIFKIYQNIIQRVNHSDSDFRVCILDPAKLSDNAWIVDINVTHSVIESAEKLVNASYKYQLQVMAEKKKKFKNVIIVADRSWAWEFLAEEDTEWIVDIWIKTTGQWELNENWNIFTIAKWKMVWYAETVFDKKMLSVFDDLTDLIYQFSKFIQLKSSRSNIILYKWEWKQKDDLVISALNWILYIYKILWLTNKSDWESYAKEFANANIFAYNHNEWSTAQKYVNPYY